MGLFEDLDYIAAGKRFFNCEVRMNKLAETKTKADTLLADESRYQVVEKETGIPWWIVGVIHQMESGGLFDRHLHNGDSLIDRTIHVPSGRPITKPLAGVFPYTWEESAADAIKGFYLKCPVWDAGHAMIYLEAYNGLGYRKHGVVSPYVWSFTTAYTSGKFIADGSFDPLAVSGQVGAAAILRLLQNWKVISLA